MAWRQNFDPQEAEIYQKRLIKVTIFVLTIFSILFVRLWFLQIIKGTEYRIQSENNRIDLKDVLPFRGLIFDRNGEILVDNRPSFNLDVVPDDVKKPDDLIDDLEKLIDIDRPATRNKIKMALKQQPFNPVCIKKNLSRDELARIETNIFYMPGVMIDVKPKRHYLYGSLAAHIIGYLGEIDTDQIKSEEYKENRLGDFVGKRGIEKKWHRHLNGIRGGQQVEVNASGRRLRVL
jgi:penicillin-binding protein 2